MSKRYYWLKLKEDFFRDKVMKKMRKIAGGDTYVVIYLKMMLMSIQTGGELYFEGIENDFADELALALDEDEENVRVALGFLMRSGKLVEKSKSVYFMPEASEAIGSESSSAERVRKFREKQKQEQLEAEVTVALPCTAETPELLQCNTGETLCNVTGNVEKSREEKRRVE
jgi:predicted phage replisome organizer